VCKRGGKVAGINLKVSTDDLVQKAQEIEEEISKFESYWNQLLQIVQNSKGYWVGDASNYHQKQIKNYQEDVNRIIKRLKEHPEDLLKMADVYEKSEEMVVKIAQSLPGDAIV
jgi:WXG100 family type VII secretion target